MKYDRYWLETFCLNKLRFFLRFLSSKKCTLTRVAALSCALLSGLVAMAVAAPDARQSTLFVNNCAQCHARQETGAPFIGVQEDWQEAVARGEDAMLINVIEGIRGMPPLGYCSACTEQDFRVLIRMMTGLPDNTASGEGGQR
jgi:cytochrome c5